jgi:hypothetical protein
LRHACSGEVARGHSAKELRRLARRSKDVNQSRRLLSLAAVRDGMDRGSAAKIGGMDRQTLRDWVHRFNASGAEGLIDNWTAGPKPRLVVPPISGSREGWGRALAADRPQTRHRRKVWRRLPPALCRKAPEEAWLLAYQRAAASSDSGRTDHRGFQKNFPRALKAPCLRRRRSKSGLRTRPASARRTDRFGSGPSVERDPGSPPTSAMTTPIYSARSAPPVASGRRWRCLMPTPR